MTIDCTTNPIRRSLIKAAPRRQSPALPLAAWAAGSDKPELTEVKVGFIPLTDCASIVMASVMGFDKKYGIKPACG